tara:strand:+ start:335 stop:3043 length:2709 start_codon:yes stop_codon:yes gene_type:complete
MSIIPPIGAGEVSTGFYNGGTSASMRFMRNVGSNTELNRDPSSAGDRKKHTLAFWVKRVRTGDGSQVVLGAFATSYSDFAYFRSDDKFAYSVGNAYTVGTDMPFRDTTNWYHVVVHFDVANSTTTNRVRFWVNGFEVDRSVLYASYPADQNYAFSNTVDQTVGGLTHFGGYELDGYLCDLHFVDGSLVDVGTFGEFKNGVWIPKKVDTSSITYGTNGFRMEFKGTDTDGPSTSGSVNSDSCGASSVNSNHFHAYSTDAANHSNLPDHPENNWCNFNFMDTSLDGANDVQYGGLAVQASGYSTIGTNFAFKSGKWYFEFKQESTTGSIVYAVGIVQTSKRKQEGGSSAWSDTGTASRIQPGGFYALYYDGGTEYKMKMTSYATRTLTSLSGHPDITGSGTSVGGGNVVGILIDMDSNPNSIKYNIDGANLTTIWEENFAFTIADDVTNIYAGQGDEFQVGVNVHQNRLRFNFGQDSTFAGTENRATNADANGHGNFHSAVPSGYLALCSANLPDPTIGPHLKDGNHADDFFKTVLYEGNGSARDITVGFQPDWLWFKNRDNTYNHVYYDSVRGPQTRFEPSQTVTEATVSTAVTDFTPSGVEGFSIGGNDGATNQSGYSIVAWCWKLGGEPTADNSAGAGNTPTSGSVKIDGSNKSDALAGTIAATRLSANTQSGVSIVTYTGNGTDGATIAHGLSKAPETVIIIGRDVANSNMIGTTGQITGFTHYAAYANASGYWVDDDSIFDDAFPTSTVFSVGTAANTNTDTKKYLAICMHHVDGFSRVGEISYAGNGSSTQGTFVHCGFKPAFVMVKRADAAGSWTVYDHLRTSHNSASDNERQYNPRDERLLLDSTNTLATSSTQAMDFASSGFRLRSNANDQNGGSIPYYFMAFAQNQPFKFSNAE